MEKPSFLTEPKGKLTKEAPSENVGNQEVFEYIKHRI